MNGANIVAASTLLFLLAGGSASAHAFLDSSVPPVGGTVATSPPEVSISFTQDVEPDFSTIAVQDSAGAPVTSGKLHATAADTLAVPVKKLGAGTYRVTWHATSVDTHKTEGSFTFTVGR
ncbi:MAG TPA: copper resistance CopC family protein [Acetobacteraceae bacterium]|nr:copper resistance CopC family protein [Acetobacteraceae bacterium]